MWDKKGNKVLHREIKHKLSRGTQFFFFFGGVSVLIVTAFTIDSAFHIPKFYIFIILQCNYCPHFAEDETEIYLLI